MAVFRTDALQPSMTRTPEGYLRGDAIASRIGVFEYTNADGSTRKELRHPDEVLSVDSLDTLKQIPVTLTHPPVMVNSANARQYQVGQTGDTYRVDEGKHIVVGFTVTDASAVQAVESGQAKQLSLGYTLDLIEESGEYEGESYTHKQTNIRYNHLALVNVARAGATATINLDGAIQFDTIEEVHILNATNPAPRLEIVRIDGFERQASPEVVKHIEELTASNTDAQKSAADMKKQMDELKGKLDAMKEEYDALKAGEGNKDSLISEAVTARLALIGKARKLTANVDGMESMSNREIMVKAITAKATSFNADGLSDEYVQGRFDTLLDMQVESVPASVAGQRADGVIVDLPKMATAQSWFDAVNKKA